ncbi:MAG: RluA family pseudouridine synthase [Clostridiales bacterium]|nr:RluA family pseudouridine synthase [Clostridiales bacterium]
MKNNIFVEKDYQGSRLDVFLTEHLGFSRSHFKNLIDKNLVLVNEKSVKSGYKLREKDVIGIEVLEPQEISTKPEEIDFEIVYEDRDLAVINKPQGLVVHPCSTTKEGTLVNGLLHRIKDLSGINGELRPGIVHRLDKDTSGLLVIAKNDFSHTHLAEQIKNKTCHRDYLAVLEGNLKDESGRIETFIKRDPKDRKKMSVQPDGRVAITDYKVLKRYQRCCLVQFSLQTGRTHQIRVHSKYLNHPVVGDKLYGKEVKSLKGQLLHAFKLSFVHPRTLERVTFEVGLPDYFEQYLKKQF